MNELMLINTHVLAVVWNTILLQERTLHVLKTIGGNQNTTQVEVGENLVRKKG